MFHMEKPPFSHGGSPSHPPVVMDDPSPSRRSREGGAARLQHLGTGGDSLHRDSWDLQYKIMFGCYFEIIPLYSIDIHYYPKTYIYMLIDNYI